MMAACCPDHGSASTPQEFSIKAAVKQLAANVAHKHRLPSSTTLQTFLEKRAWALLLDRDAEQHQEVPEVPDRAQSNRIAVEKAYEELRQQLRPADATKLQQLLQDLQRTIHYEPWVPLDPQDLSPTPNPVALTEQQAILSLLLDLRGSCPAPPPRFTTLPALGSKVVAEVQQRAEAAVAAAGAPAGRYLGSCSVLSGEADAYAVLKVGQGSAAHATAGSGRGHELLQQQQQVVSTDGFSSSWIPAAVPATELLQHLQLDPALSTAAAAVGAQCSDTTRLRDQSCNGFDATGLPSGKGWQVTSLITDLAKKMQLSSGPYPGFSSSLGLQSVDPASASAAAGVSSKRSCGRGSRQQHQAAAAADYSDSVSRTAADAEAAVAAAAAVQPMVAPLMLLSGEQPGFGGLQLLGQTPNQSSFQNVLDTLKSFNTCNSRQAVLDSKDQNSSKADLPPPQQEKFSPAAQRAAAEEQLVTVSCLALQGVWSAVGRLWEIAQQGGAAGNSSTLDASRWPGLARPAAQQHLLVQILHMAELRLRIQTFLQQFQSSSNSSSSSSNPSSHNSIGNGPATITDQAVLHTFLSAVKDVLDMHHAAIQAIQHEHQQRKQQLKRWQYQRQQQAAKHSPATSAAAAAAPAMTLLQLVVLLRSMLAQLQQLADCCWCSVGDPADSGCGFGPIGFSSSGSTSTQRLLKPMPYGCAAAAAAAVGVAIVNSGRHIPPATAAAAGYEVDVLSSNSPTRHLHSTDAAAAEGRAAAAAARAAALPWPAAAAAWVRLWDWDPSRWQVQRGFMQGQVLAEYLYAELLHAGPQTAPLLRHLFAAAVQPILQQIHTWAFQPGGAAAEAAAAAAAITSIAAVGRTSRSRSISQADSRLSSRNSTAAGSLTQDTFTLATAAAAAAGGASEVAAAGPAAGTNTAAEAAAAGVLLQAWTAAQDRAPECPKFLAGIQQQVAVAGLQLQLLQLLGGPGQQLAQRIGWLAELELQELREVFTGSSSSGGSSDDELQSRRSSRYHVDGDLISPAAGQRLGSSNPSGLLLLLGSRGAAAAAAAARGQAAESSSHGGFSASAAYLPFTSSIGQLKQAAAIISDYEHARQTELSDLMGRFTDAKAAAVEAQQARVEARLQDKAVAEEAQQQLRQAAAARKVQRKRQLLLEQKEEMAAAAARRAKSRRDELAFERQLLAQHAAAEHKAALQQVQHELAAAHRVGVQVPAAWQQHQQQQQQRQQQQQGTVSGSAAVHNGTLNSGDAQVAAAAPQQQQQQVNAAAVEQRRGLDQRQLQQQEGAAAAVADPQQPEVPAAAIVNEHTGSTILVDDELPAAQQQQQQQQQPAGVSHKRATWGPAVFDPTPAAGKPSAAEPLAVIGSAAVATAAAMPAAGRRSNSAPRVLPGMGSLLSPDQRRPRSSDSAVGFENTIGSGSRRSSNTAVQSWGQGSRQRKAEGVSLISGVLDRADGGVGSAAAGAAGHNKPVVHSHWGLAAGITGSSSSRGWRPSSAYSAAASGGSSGGARPWQQQQQGAGYRRPMHSRGSSYSGVPAAAADVLVIEDIAPEVASDYQASLVAAAGTTSGSAAAAATSSSPVISRWQHQQQQLGFMDSRRATAAGTEHNTSVGGYGYSIHPGQQQQQEVDQSTDPSNSSAPLVTTLEVLLINPILAQHRLTTLACWQLLLQEQQLLQKLAAMQALFFQQQGDWVDLFLEGFDKLLAPAAAGGGIASGLLGSSSSSDGVGGAVGVCKQGLGLSHVAAQLVLEAALQQSCLAGDEVTQRLSVQVKPKRSLPGWGTACRSLQSHATPNTPHSAAATDQIVLHYEVPWPVSLLITEQQRQQYAQIFSVLLRLRRLKQQLTKQWAAINSRPGSSSTSSGKKESGAGSALSSRQGPQAGSRAVSRADSSKPYQQQQQQSDVQRYSVPAESAAAAVDQGLDRLQQLRRWHAIALHCVSSLLATMLSELSGKLWGEFAAAVAAQPVSLPNMIEAHARLLAAAQEVCFLPAFDTSSAGANSSSGTGSGHVSRSATPTGDSKLRKSIGRLTMGMEFAVSFGSPRVAAAAVVNGTDVANLVYQLSDAAWQLQQQVQQLLLGMPAHATAAARTAPAVSSNRSADSAGLGMDEITLEVPEEGCSSSQAAGGFRNSSASRVLASMLADDESGSCWHGAKMAGWNLEGLLRTLNKHLANNRAAGVGEALAGLAARLGAMQR